MPKVFVNLPVREDVFIRQLFTTGISSGCTMSINIDDPSKLDISKGVYYIANFLPDPENTDIIKVVFPGLKAITIDNITTSPITSIGLDSNAQDVQALTTPPGPVARRRFAQLGSIVHLAGDVIESVNNIPIGIQPSISAGIADALEVLGPAFNTKIGNLLKATSNDLNFTVESGFTLLWSVSAVNNPENPNFIPLISLVSPAPIYVYRNGSGAFSIDTTQTAINPLLWDDGSGTLKTVLPSQFTVHRVYRAVQLALLHYGQRIYSTLEEAHSNFDTAVLSLEPQVVDGSLFAGWIIARGSATDLTDTSDVQIIQSGKFVLGAGELPRFPGPTTTLATYFPRIPAY